MSEHLASWGFRLANGNRRRTLLTARAKAENIGLRLRLTLEPHLNGTVAKAEFRARLSTQLPGIVAMLALCWICIGLVVDPGTVLVAPFAALGSALGVSTYLPVGVAVCALVWLMLRMLSASTAFRAACLEAQGTFWNAIREWSPARLLVPAEPQPLSGWIVWPFLVIAGGSLPVLALRYAPMLVPIVVLMALMLLATAVASRACRDYPHLYRRATALDFSFRWPLLSAWLAILFLLVYAVYLAANAAVEGGPSMQVAALPRILSMEALAAEGLEPMDSRAYEEATGRAASEMDSRTEIRLSQETWVKISTTMGAAALLALLLTLLVRILGVWQTLLRMVRDWQNHVGSSQEATIALPHLPTGLGHQHGGPAIALRTCVLMTFAAGALANWAAALLAVEAVAFVFWDRAFLWSPAYAAYSVFPESMMLLQRSLGLAGSEHTYGSIGRLTPLLFAIPSCLFLLRHVVGLLVRIGHAFGKLPGRLLSGARERKRLQAIVDRWAGRMGSRAASVRVTPSRSPHVCLRGSLLRRRQLLCVTRGALSALDEDELNATVIHELAHSTTVRKLAWAGLVSRLGLFPNNVLALLFDLVSEEFGADDVAAKLTGGTEAITGAIRKIHVGRFAIRTTGVGDRGPDRVTIEQRLKSAARNVAGRMVICDRFLFGSEIPGYTHPFASDRVARLMGTPDVLGQANGEVRRPRRATERRGTRPGSKTLGRVKTKRESKGRSGRLLECWQGTVANIKDFCEDIGVEGFARLAFALLLYGFAVWAFVAYVEPWLKPILQELFAR